MVFPSLPPTIRQLLASANNSSSIVQVNGWVKSIRQQKKVSFAVISDGSSAQGLQAVFTDAALVKSITNGASVQLTGKLTESLGAGQDKELQVESVDVLGECDPKTYPIQKQALTTEYLRDNAHLRARTDHVGAMLRLRDSMLRTLHTHFNNQGFTYTHTPILTSNDCEGAGEAFRLSLEKQTEFFTKPAYLTVSSQLHLEALANSISRVFTLSPCFRAERSDTNRHLAEFWMLEAEWAFVKDVGNVCAVVEGAIKDVLNSDDRLDLAVLWKNGDDVRRRALENAGRTGRQWPRMTYTEAIVELMRHRKIFQFEPAWGRPLQSEHERWLASELVNGPVFVTDYPAALKPFYMRANPDQQTVACFDLLVPHVGELAGGSLREERVDMLDRAMTAKGLGLAEYGWYRDLRRFGGTPHGGFGLGFERLVGWVGGIENVRECIPMPRWCGRMLL